MRTAGRVQRIGVAAIGFALAFLACGTAAASDIERQIPVIRDAAGSGLTMEISREGTRQTATPFLTLHEPTVQRIEGRIAKMTDRIAAKEIPSGATFAGPPSPTGLTGTPRGGSDPSNTTIASSPPAPGELTVRSVVRFVKGLRSSRKETPDPAVAVAAPEQRLGMADASPR